MALDVYFKYQEALDAGATFREEEEHFINQEDKPEVHKFTLMNLGDPEKNYEVDICKEGISTRANHWGSNYVPLTEWLHKNNIEWEEG